MKQPSPKADQLRAMREAVATRPVKAPKVLKKKPKKPLRA